MMTNRLSPKQIAICALRGFLIYFFFALVLQMTTGLLYASGIRLPGIGIYSSARLSEDMGLSFNFAHVLTMLVIPFLYYSIARAFALSDTYGYNLACETDDGHKPRMNDVLASPCYFITLAAIALGYIVFPLSFGFNDLQAWLDFASVLGSSIEKALFGIPLLIIFPLLLALAQASARREWQKICAERRRPDVRDETSGLIGFFKNKTGLGGLISSLFLILWLYPIGSYAGSVLFSFALPFIIPMVQDPFACLIGLGFILVVLLAFMIPSYLRAFVKRQRLMRRLKKVCRSCNYELHITGHPYLNLIHYRGDADFSVKVGEKQYDCKLIGAVIPGGKMLFGYDGKVQIHHYIRFFWAARALNTATMHTFEQSTFHTEIDYSFKSTAQKVLIVCPAAPQTLIAGPHGGSPIDTGAHIGDYRMFNTTGFLGALERDCLDR